MGNVVRMEMSMKKYFFKKLQSLTAILVLNTIPASFAQTDMGYDTEALQARVLCDDRKGALKRVKQQADSLNRLYLDNSLAYIQKYVAPQTNYQHQMALALIEEAYQEDFDALLDKYEKERGVVASNSHNFVAVEAHAEEGLKALKDMRDAKIVEFNRQFGFV